MIVDFTFFSKLSYYGQLTRQKKPSEIKVNIKLNKVTRRRS